MGCGPPLGALGEDTAQSGGLCAGPSVPIAEVQGPGASSPLLGETVRVQGVVTLALGDAGFFLQSEHHDADPVTSEGLFIATAAGQLAVGRRVSARGQVAEREGTTQLEGVEAVSTCGAAALAPVAVDARELAELLDADRLEPWENMWIRASGGWSPLEIASPEALAATPGGRWYGPGHELGAASAGRVGWTVRGDAKSDAEPRLRMLPRPRLDARADELRGVVELTASGPVLHLSSPAVWRSEVPAPPPAPATEVLRVAALNVDNYFVDPGGRGARTPSELSRQRAKLVATLLALDADILALTELGSAPGTLEHLAAGLNAEAGSEPYSHDAAAPAAAGPLRAALLYRGGRVVPAEPASFAAASGFTRPPLLQAFWCGAESLTIGVTHFKSKRCDAAAASSDLSGCGAEVRRTEAEALLRVVRALPAQRRAWVLWVGDFNADALEPPLLALHAEGLRDVLGAVPASERYSYVYQGRASLLDHALASPAVAQRVRRAGLWHINADELPARGYRASRASPGPPDPARSSDHDPLWVDLEPCGR